MLRISIWVENFICTNCTKVVESASAENMLNLPIVFGLLHALLCHVSTCVLWTITYCATTKAFGLLRFIASFTRNCTLMAQMFAGGAIDRCLDKVYCFPGLIPIL